MHEHPHHHRGSLAGRLGTPRPDGSQPGLFERALRRFRGFVRREPHAEEGLGPLPPALRRGELARAYLSADRVSDHRRAAVAASTASARAARSGHWWPADVWAHRALWHYEQADLLLHATRAARRIGDLRVAAGDPAAARRYYAEAISEARDLGAEREQGLASLGMGRAALQLGDVTTSRRLAQIAAELLERGGGSPSEVSAARDLRGDERVVRPSGHGVGA